MAQRLHSVDIWPGHGKQNFIEAHGDQYSQGQEEKNEAGATPRAHRLSSQKAVAKVGGVANRTTAGRGSEKARPEKISTRKASKRSLEALDMQRKLIFHQLRTHRTAMPRENLPWFSVA